MKVLRLLDHLAAAPAPADPAAAPTPRRALLRQLGQAAAATLPLSLLGPAPATAAPAATLDSLTLLLRLERTQLAFYTQALAAGSLLSAALRPEVQRLQAQQQGHLTFLAQAFANSGVPLPAAPAAYDFTAGRGGQPAQFPNALRTEAGFLELAQQLEDAGVRIYLGQTVALAADRPLLSAVQRLTTLEARHAAHVRQLRRRRGAAVKTWPSSTDAPPTNPLTFRPSVAPTPPAATTLYAGEANERQFLSGLRPIPFNLLLQNDFVVQSSAIAESFDEPLSLADANILLSLFAD